MKKKANPHYSARHLFSHITKQQPSNSTKNYYNPQLK